MSTDPFASATTGTGNTDPFGQKPSEVKTSSFPTMDELDGKLLVIQPTKNERVADKFSKEPNATRDRVTADVTVIDPASPKASVTHKDMYLSQGALVGQVKGFIENRGMLLGTLRKHPARNSPDVTPITATPVIDPDSTDKLMAEWLQAGAKGNKPSFAWKLADFTETEKAAALEWYRSK